MYIVKTKFNAFYVARKLEIVKENRHTRKEVLLTDAWRIIKKDKSGKESHLHYDLCVIKMKYVRIYGKASFDGEPSYSECEKIINSRKFKEY